MNPRIASIENLIARDPGGRNIFGLLLADHLRLAAQSLRLARRVGIVSGFFIPEANAGETDGPPGAKVVGEALTQLGIRVDYITDERNAPLFRALGLNPIIDATGYLDDARPSHLLSIERVGRGSDGRYRNMRGVDITTTTAPLDELFLRGARRGLTTVGIGDGGNEIGMGRVFAEALAAIEHGAQLATIVPTDFCIVAGVSNWGAYGLAGALSVLENRDLLPTAERASEDIARIVSTGGAVDGVTFRREPTVDGLPNAESLRMLEEIRHHIAPSPLEQGGSLTVGVLGYGDTGRAAAALLFRKGHQVRLSDSGAVNLTPGLHFAGVETGGHTMEFLESCNLVVVSPGVPPDAPIREQLHVRGIPIMSELELAYQLCRYPLIAVTGTIGKRTTVELIRDMFRADGRALPIGGNRGTPLSALLLDGNSDLEASVAAPMAIAVSSFQLETVVHFRPHVAIVLNLTAAHLDRHRTLAEYARIKSRIFMNHHPDDVLVLNFDHPRLRPLARKHHGRTLFVSCKQEVDRGAWLIDGVARINLTGITEEIGAANHPFPEDLLSAMLAARLYGIEPATLSRFLRATVDASGAL